MLECMPSDANRVNAMCKIKAVKKETEKGTSSRKDGGAKEFFKKEEMLLESEATNPREHLWLRYI